MSPWCRYACALRNLRAINTIRHGPIGRIALYCVEWGRPTLQFPNMPWAVTHSKAVIEQFTKRLRKSRVRSAGAARRSAPPSSATRAGCTRIYSLMPGPTAPSPNFPRLARRRQPPIRLFERASRLARNAGHQAALYIGEAEALQLERLQQFNLDCGVVAEFGLHHVLDEIN